VMVDGDSVENAATAAIKQAPVLIVLCAELHKAGYRHDGTALTNKAESWYIFDVALAMQNLCLAATDAGLGTCIVGGFNSTKVEQLLGIPESLTVVSMTPVGVPSSPGQVSPRKKVKDLTYYESFK
jgi:nitroreductase